MGPGRDKADALEKVRALDAPLELIATYCDGYSDCAETACDHFFNGESLSAVDCVLVPTLTLLEQIVVALQGQPMQWPGARLERWFAAASGLPTVHRVMKEGVSATTSWIDRKVQGLKFGDNWWRPENYGGTENAHWP